MEACIEKLKKMVLYSGKMFF